MYAYFGRLALKRRPPLPPFLGDHIKRLGRGPFKYYVIMFLTFLGPPTQLFDDLQYTVVIIGINPRWNAPRTLINNQIWVSPDW